MAKLVAGSLAKVINVRSVTLIPLILQCVTQLLGVAVRVVSGVMPLSRGFSLFYALVVDT